MKMRNVLVFPAGTEIGLEIFQALRYCKEVRLFGAGQDISNHARFVYPEYHVVPSIHESEWLNRLVNLCRELAIDYIFPAYDDVIVALSRNADHLPATIISSGPRACEISRSKSDTYRILADKIRVPVMYESAGQVTAYPVLVKPDRGQGSQGIHKVLNHDHLIAALRAVNDPIICEYLPGEEYTIDCFSDRERGLLFAGARSRRRTRNGISVNTKTEYLPEVHEMASIIGREMGLRGAWFFQLKRATDGELALLEVAPRIAGAMATHRVIGVNFPLLSIFEEERLPIAISPNHLAIELDRALSNRYLHPVRYSALYVDLDDTLLVNGRVNPQVIKLIFQCINNGKPVRLITRHQGNIALTLAKHRIACIFDEIIHLSEGEPKSKFITESDAIFVDDSFSERNEVAHNCGILTFDCSMVELLTEQAESINNGVIND